MAKRVMTGGMLAMALVFGLALTGCASLMEGITGKKVFLGGATEADAVLITFPSVYEVVFDGEMVPRETNPNLIRPSEKTILGVPPGEHTFSVVKKWGKELTLEGTYNFASGTAYAIDEATGGTHLMLVTNDILRKPLMNGPGGS